MALNLGGHVMECWHICLSVCPSICLFVPFGSISPEQKIIETETSILGRKFKDTRAHWSFWSGIVSLQFTLHTHCTVALGWLTQQHNAAVLAALYVYIMISASCCCLAWKAYHSSWISHWERCISWGSFLPHRFLLLCCTPNKGGGVMHWWPLSVRPSVPYKTLSREWKGVASWKLAGMKPMTRVTRDPIFKGLTSKVKVIYEVLSSVWCNLSITQQ